MNLLITFLITFIPNAAPVEIRKPNIILVVADDLGSAELGCYGQKIIKTPHLDLMAQNGLRFNRFYSGNAVCAPSRSVLMTGLHSGHTPIRDNREAKPEGQHPLPDGTLTLAKLMKQAGYATGAMGKWGLGGPDSKAHPNLMGFDLFYGYNCQRVAHNHYPKYLWRNDKKEELEGNDAGVTGKQFSHDLMEKEALKFISDQQSKPFFLFLPFIIPHVALQIPDELLKEYKGKFEDPAYVGGKGYQPHPSPRAAYAAMITRLDKTMGKINALLKELKLDQDTIVMFTSDNGPTHGGVGGSDSEFFNSAGILRGLKGSLYEGGIRVPLIAYCPGKIPEAKICNTPFGFQDLLPTCCEIAGIAAPSKIDGISMLPTFVNKGEQRTHEMLYWEFPGYGGQQALILGKWKGVKQKMGQGNNTLELYDLESDPSESTNVASKNQEIAVKMELNMKGQHTPNKDFPLPIVDFEPKKNSLNKKK